MKTVKICKCCNNESTETVLVHGYGRVCPDCLRKHKEEFLQCPDCGDWYVRSTMARLYECEGDENPTYWCNDCAELLKVWRCTSCGERYLSRLPKSICRRCIGDNPVQGYGWKPDHDGPMFGMEGTEYDEEHRKLPHIGVEIEIENGHDRYELARHLMLDYPEIYCKRDGSLNSSGIEMVTFPMTYDYLFNKFPAKEVFDLCQSFDYKSHDTSNCGFHIHVSKSAFGKNEDELNAVCTKLVLIFRKFWNSHIIPFTRRKRDDIDRWAGINPQFKDFHTKETMSSIRDRIANQVSEHDRRYVAINMQNAKTVEFRIFKGTLDVNAFYASIEWVMHMIELAKKTKLRDIDSLDANALWPETPSEYFSHYLSSRKRYFKEEETVSRVIRAASSADLGSAISVIPVGTKVTIKPYDVLLAENELWTDASGKKYLLTDRYIFTDDMKEFCGKTFTVLSASIDGSVIFKEAETSEYGFSECMFTVSGEGDAEAIDYEKIDLDI